MDIYKVSTISWVNPSGDYILSASKYRLYPECIQVWTICLEWIQVSTISWVHPSIHYILSASKYPLYPECIQVSLYLEWIHVNKDSFHKTLSPLSFSAIHSRNNLQTLFYILKSTRSRMGTKCLFVNKRRYLSTKVGGQELLILDLVCTRLKQQWIQ